MYSQFKKRQLLFIVLFTLDGKVQKFNVIVIDIGMLGKVSPGLYCNLIDTVSTDKTVREFYFLIISIELNFGDPDVLAVSKIGKKVGSEAHRVVQFLRFQKAADGTFFAAVRPVYNVLPLTLSHLTDRFADQRWLVYDVGRAYGYYYDLREAVEVRFAEQEAHLLSGKLDEARMAADERLFQQLWKTYFQSIAIRERLNPRLHKQNMPARFWKFMPEKW